MPTLPTAAGSILYISPRVPPLTRGPRSRSSPPTWSGMDAPCPSHIRPLRRKEGSCITAQTPPPMPIHTPGLTPRLPEARSIIPSSTATPDRAGTARTLPHSACGRASAAVRPAPLSRSTACPWTSPATPSGLAVPPPAGRSTTAGSAVRASGSI